jgi:predicted RNase H-like HicB family nuclease
VGASRKFQIAGSGKEKREPCAEIEQTPCFHPDSELHLHRINSHQQWEKYFFDVGIRGSNMSVEAHHGAEHVNLRIEFEREDDGRWIAEIPDLPGVMCYGATKEEAEVQVQALALQVIAEQIKENMTAPKSISFASA